MAPQRLTPFPTSAAAESDFERIVYALEGHGPRVAGVPEWAWRSRDLALPELWDLSRARSAARRHAAANRPHLLRARKAGLSLVVAAVAAAAPARTSAGSGSSGSVAGSGVERGQLLSFGSRGAGVATVQRALGIPADGIFGPQTRRAVRAFQRDNGLLVDGVVGPQTRGALAASRAGSGRMFRAPWVAPLQRQLGIPADGIFGPQTRAAVRAFQAERGLVVDGIVGPQTRAALRNARSGGGNGFRMFRAPWVAPVQQALGIPADGIFGPQTRAAVRAFQAERGLVVDGIVGPQTLGALGLSGSSGGRSGSGGGGGGGGSGGAVAASSSVAGTVLAAARSQLGKPYAWGGSGPGSFDCSGLTMWSFRQAGISLPHQSQAQFGYGRSVSRSSVRAGDLVFFSTNGSGASHVGIALDGSSFISATTHGVRVQPIGGSYWGPAYVGARRIS